MWLGISTFNVPYYVSFTAFSILFQVPSQQTQVTRMGCFDANNDSNPMDEEIAGQNLKVDLSDDRWILDLELDNIISNISENESWTTSFRRGFQGSKDNEQTPNELGKVGTKPHIIK
jgi:hypothetical protein